MGGVFSGFSVSDCRAIREVRDGVKWLNGLC